ncbi:hypothetical protein FHR75_003822 [Kineococcus radiotolerans]|uniref:Integral membrane protein n=1 Tax=Kineococcus radiotolerans TaxID=131568 RepID=A0A7W4XYB5_KINRA|nr:hypothetical protein [Kineococcus radiotolerans]MBB2902986.1 hypothetical protein [Kineococcus radiotolerans]
MQHLLVHSTAPEVPVPTATTTAPAPLAPPVPLQRAAGLVGLLSAAVLALNAAKRAGLVPATPLTQLLAPLAEVFALALVTALFLVCAPRIGVLGRIAFGVNHLALGALVGVEFVINLVFAELGPEQIADLRAGPLGAALTASSLLFLVGSLAFTASLARTALPPRGALALYAAGAVPVALRAFVPELVLDLGLLGLAAGVAWLATWLLRTAPAGRR